MKRFFMFMAATLLSITAFAQSESKLKGDVNGDGKVNVEDVTSVVDIILSGKTYGYFYFGTTEPTAENFTSLPGVIASYTSIGEAVGVSASVDAGQIVYMLCPAAWMKGKHVEVEDGEGNSYDFVEDTDAGIISGYVIYKTQAFNEATDAILKFNNSSAETYYWYVGHNNPMNMTDDDIIPLQSNDASEGPGWRTIGTTLPTYNQANPLSDEIISTATSKSTQYVALPSDQIKSRNAITGEDITDEGWTISSEKKILKGVEYTIWTSINNKKSFADLLY